MQTVQQVKLCYRDRLEEHYWKRWMTDLERKTPSRMHTDVFRRD
jgi:hypothetical protein